MGRATTLLRFRHVIVDPHNPPDPHCKAAGDLDGDGCPDLLAASASGGGLDWYRYPDWRKCPIAAGAFTTDMAVGDIDGDGCLDVVIPSDDGLIWFRNPRAAGGDPACDPWQAVNVGPQGARMHDVELADLDGDGQLDIVTRHQSGFGKWLGNAIHLWVQQTPTTWRHRTFACPHGEGLAVADLNGNGRPDIAIGGCWYENPGDALAGAWAEHAYVDPVHFDRCWTRGDVVVQVGDLNGNGRPDIALSPAEGSGHLSWFEAPDDPRAGDWIEHVIDAQMDHAHGLGLADMDGDGALDIVVAKMHQATAPQEVAVYFNRGAGASWDKHVVATTGSHNIVLVDVGCSGRIDIYGANWNNRSPTHGSIELWLNEG
ncbi:MAG: VCBS repeat-containing protein [Anaerolineae bacterium]|nr:VCBS repeat-containing protein [Anaerolineae bacterium]